MGRSVWWFFSLLLFFNNSFAQSAIDHWESIVLANDTWRYFQGTSEPPSSWIASGFNDDSWSTGTGGFGYGDNDDGTIIDASSVYLRIKFNIIDLSWLDKLVMLADYDDAFVAYLNGLEIARNGISGNPPAHNQFADAEHEAQLYKGQYPEEIIFTKNELTSLLVNGENTLAIQVHNADANSSDLSSNFYLVAGLNVSATTYRPVPGWFKTPLSFDTSNLPIIKINTGGAYIPDEPKIGATMGIVDNGFGNINAIDDPFTDFNGNIAIEVRGSSSQSFPKKQYAVELRTTAGQDTSASILGLPEEEDWVLYAPYSDKSLLRNVLAYKLGRELGWYAPRTKLVEIYLNDQYQGVYVLSEKIKRDKNRVNISALNPDENSGDDLTGGYIVKLDKYDGATQGFGWDSPYPPPHRSNKQVIHFQYHYPKEDEITSAQSNYIQGFITQFEETLKGPKFRDPIAGYRTYINVASFIDFAIINELTKNVDGYRLSTFLYKDKDSKDNKLYIGPIWDFNLAFGNADYCEGGSYTGWGWEFNSYCNGDWWLIPFWWERLLRDPEYVIHLKNRWIDLRSGAYSNTNIMNYIDSLAAVLDEPQQRNFITWPILNDYVWPNNYIGGSFANEINYLKSWIGGRLSWLDSNIASLDVITGLDMMDSYQNITVFPNPTNQSFSIRFNEINTIGLKMSLISQLGEVIIDKSLNSSNIKNNTFDLSVPDLNLNKGVYLLHITDHKHILFKQKLVVY